MTEKIVDWDVKNETKQKIKDLIWIRVVCLSAEKHLHAEDDLNRQLFQMHFS